MGGGGHVVGIAAYFRAQLHIFVVRNLAVGIDNDLSRADQGEQRRAEGIQADLLLLVGDTRCPSGVRIKHRIHQRLDTACGIEDVLVSLAPLFRFQGEIRIVEYARIAHQHVDGRLEFLLNRGDKSTADGLSGLGTSAGLLQLKELLFQPAVLIMAIDQHAHEQCDDSQSHQPDYYQLYASYLSLIMLCLKLVDVVRHVYHVQFQCFSLTDKSEAVLQF